MSASLGRITLYRSQRASPEFGSVKRDLTVKLGVPRRTLDERTTNERSRLSFIFRVHEEKKLDNVVCLLKFKRESIRVGLVGCPLSNPVNAGRRAKHDWTAGIKQVRMNYVGCLREE